MMTRVCRFAAVCVVAVLAVASWGPVDASIVFRVPERHTIACGDGSSCLSDQTCCPDGAGGYGCCPTPDATCCEDHIHCCPLDYPICDINTGSCRDSDGKTVAVLKKFEAIAESAFS